MQRYVAFLRGMNLGRRRIKNDELCACFADMGFLVRPPRSSPSGNIIFDAELDDPAGLSDPNRKEGSGRRSAMTLLTFLRSALMKSGPHHAVWQPFHSRPAQAIEGQNLRWLYSPRSPHLRLRGLF